MNLVGKIFVVLIFVMSLVFMAFSVMVYATHTNWRDVVIYPREGDDASKPLGLKFQLEDEKDANDKLNDQLTKVSKDLNRAEGSKRHALSVLETEVDALTRERDQQEKDLATQTQAVRDAVAAMDAVQKTLAALRGEVDGLRTEIRQTQQERDQSFAKMVQQTDEAHVTALMLKSLKDRATTVAADLAKAKEVLRKHNLKGDPAVYTGIPPRVNGEVLALGSNGSIEISIGADDGLIKGHALEVYRINNSVNTYLGRVEVTETVPDKAVCKILPQFRKGTVEVGDSVASKIE